jgi:MutS domain V
MSILSDKEERLRLLEAQIARLRERIARLERRGNRYSWARVIIFFGGLALSVAVCFLLGWWVGLGLAVAIAVAFGIVAHFHGQVERSSARHTILLYIQEMYQARIQLNWEGIPAAEYGESPEHPFAIDLDITGRRSMHRLLNIAVSQEGSQRLGDWLLQTEPDLETIQRRQELVRELAPLALFRDKLLLSSLISAQGAKEQLEGKRLLEWLKQHNSSKGLGSLLVAATILNALTIVLFALSLFGIVPQLWIFSIVCAVILLWTTGEKRGHIFEDASYLSYAFARLGAVFTYLERYRYGRHERLKRLCEPFWRDREHSPTNLLRKIEHIASAATLKNNGLLWLIVNALLPWDAYCAYRLSQYKERISGRLPVWLDVWFELEAVSSLATFAYLNPEYAWPQVMAEKDGPCFEARDLGHPLLTVDKKVVNDFSMEKLGEIVIITGSNMSGKSTFLRTLGVNLVLAFAGGPVNASMLSTSLFRVFTCIRVSDSVTDGYSYFYAEVRRLRQLLDTLEKPGFPLFFLIDEIFKGTNNRERLVGSRAYIRALVGRTCLGIISTHDLELIKLADTLPGVKNDHFKEEIIDGSMHFDYTLRPGPSPTTNALKIMRMEGLPVDIEEGVERA